MKRILIVITIFISNISYGQVSIEKYIKSYPILKETNTATLYTLYNQHVKMTKEEALTYVANGDTTKLYCPDLDYDGWEEKIYGMTIGEYLPEKCIRVDNDNYYLICYAYTECDSKGVDHKFIMTFEIYDKNYKRRDSLIVYISGEYDEYVDGLYNPQTQKIYTYNRLSNKYSSMYTINSQTLKFEELRRYDGKVNAKLEKQIDALGWGDLFYSDDCE